MSLDTSPVPGVRPTAAARMARAAGEIGLTAAAIVGLACVLLVAASAVFGVGLMMFRTGSMSPAIPAGAVAVVRTVPATEVAPGDVVTVERPGRMPVTHRVVSADPTGDGRTTLVMKGDANDRVDRDPYVVDDVRLVVASTPSGAWLLASARQPLVLVLVTLGATVLVTWSFWPRERRTHRSTS